MRLQRRDDDVAERDLARVAALRRADDAAGRRLPDARRWPRTPRRARFAMGTSEAPLRV